MIDYPAIKKFLEMPGIEGKPACIGYIPCQPKNYTGADDPSRYRVFGYSGVTVATGFDLGQRTISELTNKLKFPAYLVDKLSPYVGCKQRNATAILHKKPLTLTTEDVDIINSLFIPYYCKTSVQPYYDRDAKGGSRFENIPSAAQCVIYSILYQRGPGYIKSMKITWKALTNGEWEEAAKELMSSNWSDYRNRRNLEGKYLYDGTNGN